MATSDVDFVKTSEVIVAKLLERSEGLGHDELERIKYVYNEAIDDAANFVKELASRNPMYRMALQSCEKELRHWLKLR